MAEKQRILIVDDTPTNIRILHDLLKNEYRISVAMNGPDAIGLARSKDRPDLILLDIMMPEMDGYEVCRQLKADEMTRNIPILFVTAMGEVENETKGLEVGAVDYLTKPISPSIVKARIHNHMALRYHQEQLEELVSERALQIKKGYIDTVHRLTLASEYKDEDTGAHIKRISYYTKAIAERLGMDREFCDRIFYASPIHDIGKVAIPDAVLLKQGLLNKEEWVVMKTHTTVGAKILEGSKSPYLQMAIDIANSHHERWDGNGYPLGLKGDNIPFTARIMNISDQYDALRSRRPYKPSFDHRKTVSILTEGDGRTTPEHFDPDILSSFTQMADIFNDIFNTYKDEVDN